MSANASDDTDRFLRAIAAFSAEAEPLSEHGRRIATHSTTALERVLTEIDETVVRRLVQFTTGRGDALTLDLSERRVHQITAVPPNLRDTHQELIGKSLTSEHAQQFLALLNSFTVEVDVLYAKASLADACQTTGFSGVSVSDLRSSMQNENCFVPECSDVDELIAGIGRDAKALFVRRGDEPLLKEGDCGALNSLEGLSASLDDPSGGEPRVTLWCGVGDLDCAVLLARLNGTQIAALLPAAVAWSHFGHVERAIVATRE